MSQNDFFQNFKVGQKGLLVCINTKKLLSTSIQPIQRTSEYIEYCKNMLTRFKPWEDDVKDTWNNSEEDTIAETWETFLESFGDTPRNFLQTALADHKRNNKREEASQRLGLDAGSFGSLDSQGEDDEDDLLSNTATTPR